MRRKLSLALSTALPRLCRFAPPWPPKNSVAMYTSGTVAMTTGVNHFSCSHVHSAQCSRVHSITSAPMSLSNSNLLQLEMPILPLSFSLPPHVHLDQVIAREPDHFEGGGVQ